MKGRLLQQEAALFCFLAGGFLLFSRVAGAQELRQEAIDFAVHNPDGQKYDFVKTYMMALEYLYRNEAAKAKLAPLNETTIKRSKSLAKERDRLKSANINLRIARNLLENFNSRNNSLMLKVISTFGSYADEETALNNRQRTLVSILYEASLENRVSSVKRRWYSQHLAHINERRRENAPLLLEASMLIGKVLISHEFNRLGEFYKLGISPAEREKLLDRLDVFEGEEFRGEVRPGQSYLQASVASIREVLDDRDWPAL